MVIIIMGVSASGKTTIGQAVAAAMDWSFSDADDFHSPVNVEKMRRGTPLSDEDREPWLRAIRTEIEKWKRNQTGHVLACSALKKTYREILAQSDPDVKFVYLQGTFDLFADRLKQRKGHFFNATLLRSQLDALEVPKGALVVDASKDPREIRDVILEWCKSGT
ncbi:MAG TPA: gluconokinase [Terrimicrobiaceae bacterium]